MSDNHLKLRPPPLPAKLDDWKRFLKIDATLNDLVEAAHRSLVEKPEYRKLLDAVYDADAVEGSLACDNVEAARAIRIWAKSNGTELANKKLAVIVKALNVVLRRYHASRKQRRNMVGGQVVAGDGGE